ncbi:MAG TPA: TIGR03668 family PPOX class F420-dependent oxidoreductase [Actinomycetota bacterium]
MNQLEARQRFVESRVVRLATVRTGGGPHVVPCVFVADGDRIVSVVDEKPKRSKALQRLANIRANPRVSLLADRYDEDWLQLWWVRADGTATVVETGPERDRAVALLQRKYAQYLDQPPTGAAVVVTVDAWSWWTAEPHP